MPIWVCRVLGGGWGSQKPWALGFASQGSLVAPAGGGLSDKGASPYAGIGRGAPRETEAGSPYTIQRSWRGSRSHSTSLHDLMNE